MSPETFYRRLLRAYPADYRRHREDEMVAVLIDASANSLPTPAQSWDLLRSGLVVRWRFLRADRIGFTGMLIACTLALAASCFAAQVTVVRGRFVDTASHAVALPRQFPSWDPVPATLAESPPGVSVASYAAGDSDWDYHRFQIIVGADGRTIRRDESQAATSLSADGRYLATIDADRLVLRSLVSGKQQRLAPGGTKILAWSRDSRVLLLQRNGRLVRVEPSSGAQLDMGVTGSAAYAFNDDRLALLRDGTLQIIDGTRLVRSYVVPGGGALAAAGWAPDDRRIALDAGGGAALLDLSSGQVAPIAHPGRAFGWVAPSTLLVRDVSSQVDKRPLEAVDVTTGATHVVSRFSARGEFQDVQFATQLTRGLTPTDVGRFGRGPGQQRLWLLASLLLILLTGFLGAIFTDTRPSASWRRVAKLCCKHIVISVCLLVPFAVVTMIFIAIAAEDVQLQTAATLLGATAAYIAGRSVTRSLRRAAEVQPGRVR